ncbi:MAG: hypothetical protein NVSMB2_14040 [Chloroflexota bacterium]
MPRFRLIELHPRTKQRTGRQYDLDGQTRQAALDEALGLLDATSETAMVDPTRTLIEVHSELWTLVGTSAAPGGGDSSALRRAGAKHKRVR